MFAAIQRLLAAVSFTLLFYGLQAQPVTGSPTKTGPRPFKVLTSGKLVTIKSSKPIAHVMLWTSNGNRVVEQKQIANHSYSFTVPVSQKVFYLMVGLEDGNIYTQKLGLP